MIKSKFVSSLEKCFFTQTLEDFAEIRTLRMFKNERASVQFLAQNYDDNIGRSEKKFHRIEIQGELADCVAMRTVESVPNYVTGYEIPENSMKEDPAFLNNAQPGLYPDVLIPLTHNSKFPILVGQLHPVWIDFEINGKVEPGRYPVKVVLYDTEDEIANTCELEVEVLDIEIPEQETIVTNWFYADCLADYYEVEIFSDRHFEICENYIKTAVKNGINMLLTPVFTPPLDTAVGHERPTTQLVGVTVKDGKYSFDFSLMDRWIDMCDRCGIKYLEISHLFTQWGAYHAPKIMATVDGEYKRIFGWDTDAAGDEYVTFIRQFLTEFTAYLEAKGRKGCTYFHISDEPNDEHLAQYKINKGNVGDILKGWKILDALSNVEFFKQGLCEIPVPISNVIEDFMPEEIPERWVYYCCGPFAKASNQFLIGSLTRTRCLGIQMYKYGIEGFLHWGYNFYNNQFSEDVVNPFLNMCAGYWTVGGDALVVYPGRKGMPIESIRLLARKQAYDDIAILKLCESYYGKERVVSEIEAIYGEVTFMKCIEDSAQMQKIRDRIIDLIVEAKK